MGAGVPKMVLRPINRRQFKEQPYFSTTFFVIAVRRTIFERSAGLQLLTQHRQLISRALIGAHAP
jgi:hypothetical protein